MVPSESAAVLAQGLPCADSREPFKRNSSPRSVVISSSTMRIWPTPFTRFEPFTITTWPSTKLPTGTISLPFTTTGCSTYPENLSPVLLVFDVRVVCSLTCSELPAGRRTPWLFLWMGRGSCLEPWSSAQVCRRSPCEEREDYPAPQGP